MLTYRSIARDSKDCAVGVLQPENGAGRPTVIYYFGPQPTFVHGATLFLSKWLSVIHSSDCCSLENTLPSQDKCGSNGSSWPRDYTVGMHMQVQKFSGAENEGQMSVILTDRLLKSETRKRTVHSSCKTPAPWDEPNKSFLCNDFGKRNARLSRKGLVLKMRETVSLPHHPARPCARKASYAFFGGLQLNPLITPSRISTCSRKHT